MGDRVRNLFTIYQNKWQAMEKAQKRRLSLAVVGAFIAVAVTLFFALRPNWVFLQTNLSPDVATSIQEVLEIEGIPFRTSPNFRTIEVRERDFERALSLSFSSGALSPSQGLMREGAFDLIGMTTSEDVRDQIFNETLENQIARSLVSLSGISHADVNINPGNPNAILQRDANRASASVVLTTYIDIDSAMALSLAYTVANAVSGLSTTNVNIMDQHMRTIFNGELMGDDRFGPSGVEDPIARHSILMTNNVRNVLSSVFDGVHVSPSPSVTHTDTIVQSLSHFAPEGAAAGLVTNSNVFTQFLEGTAGGSVAPAGLDANIGIVSFGEASDMMAESFSEVLERVVDTVHSRTVYLHGALNREESSVAVTVYNNVIHNEAVLRQTGVLDDYESFEHYRIVHGANIMVPEDEFPNFEQIVQLSAAAAGVPAENVTVMLVNRPLFFEEIVTPVNWQTIVFFAILVVFLLLLAFGLLRSRRSEEIGIEPEPELSVEDLLVTTRIEADEEIETQKLQDLAYAVDSEVKQQIDKFVNEKPEAVAQLLRSWINEGWE